MTQHRKELGTYGEDIARAHIEKLGYLVIDRNFTTHWGELDIIARKGKIIYFIEVKTKIGDKKGKPYESVTRRKLHSLKRSINMYLLKNDYKTYKLSLGVVSIELFPDKSVKELLFFDTLDF